MLQTDRILVATDFSNPAERARRQAEHLAAVHDAALHVLHVTGDAELAELFDALPDDKVTARRAQAYLAEWLGQPIEPPSASREEDAHHDDGETETVPEETWTVRHGDAPAEEILSYAEEIDTNLLVLGAETQSQLLGGVTDAVVRRALRPVITVPPRRDEKNTEPRVPRDLPRETLQRLQVAVNGAEPTPLLLEHARVLAAANGASVDLVRVPHSSIASALSMPWGRAERASKGSSQTEKELDGFAKQLQRAGIPARTRVLSGKPASAITRYAQKRRMDLILMEAHVQSGLPQTILGSVAERVIRTAPCPVASFRGDAQSLLPGEGRPAINWNRRKHFGTSAYRSEEG